MYLPNPGSAQIQQYVQQPNGNYALAANITSITAGSSGVRLGAAGQLYAAVRASGAIPASFHFRDEANKRLWTVSLPELGNIEARGLGVSPSGDTLIYCGWNGTGIHRYVRVRDGQVPPKPITNIPTYRITQVNGISQAGIADSVNVYTALEGVVNSPNFRETGLEFSLVDEKAGIGVFRAADNLGYSVKPGDRLRVIGRLSQENGLLRINADTVMVLAGNAPLTNPVTVSELTDSLESMPVRLSRVRLLDAAQWTTGQGYYGFHVEVTDSIRTYRLFIDRQTELYHREAPLGYFAVSGILSQFSEKAPYLSGYEIIPRTNADIHLTDTTNPGENIRILLYPNPARRFITIAAEASIEAVRIYNFSGTVVKSLDKLNRKVVFIDLRNVPGGLYIAAIRINGQWITQQLIKQD